MLIISMKSTYPVSEFDCIRQKQTPPERAQSKRFRTVLDPPFPTTRKKKDRPQPKRGELALQRQDDLAHISSDLTNFH